jgi:hypothetical protein
MKSYGQFCLTDDMHPREALPTRSIDREMP